MALARHDKQQPPSDRRCIASGRILPKANLMRFVVDPTGALVPDLAGGLPGRGLWLLPCRDMLNKAARQNLFAKAAKRPVQVPPDIGAQVERLLTRRCLDLIGLERRAGGVVAGFEKVRVALRNGRVGLLLQAVDAAEDGRRKLRGLAAAGGVTVVEVLTAAELGRAFGEQGRVHVALAPGSIAERLRSEMRRLAGVRRVSAE